LLCCLHSAVIKGGKLKKKTLTFEYIYTRNFIKLDFKSTHEITPPDLILSRERIFRRYPPHIHSQLKRKELNGAPSQSSLCRKSTPERIPPPLQKIRFLQIKTNANMMVDATRGSGSASRDGNLDLERGKAGELADCVLKKRGKE